MTPRFKVALAVFGALALATAALWLALGDGVKGLPVPGPTAGAGSSPPGEVPRAVGEQPTLEVGPEAAPGLAGDGVAPRPRTEGLQPGLRVPSGVDLSDARVVQGLLAEHLSAAEVDWQAVIQLCTVLQEPLGPEARERLLKELVSGHRVGASGALAVLHDPTMVSDLFDLLDSRELSDPARQGVLQALAGLPAGEDSDVVRGLESRMTGEARGDTLLLQAIARRGGKEAARAIVQFLQASASPRATPVYVFAQLDIDEDPAAAEVVVQALRAEERPEVLRALIDLSGKAGAPGVAEALIGLNRDGLPDEVRQAAVTTLGRVGTAPAVDYLVRLSEQPGAYGQLALQAIGSLEGAPKESLDRLTARLEEASRHPRPQEAKEQLLLALGSARHGPAIPLMGEALKDPAPAVRLSAVRGLGRMGERARSYVPELVNLYATGDDTLRRQVILSLGTIGGEQARSALSQMAEDKSLSPSLLRTVQVALRDQGAAAGEGGEPAPRSGAGLTGSGR